jgi:2-isopropylmalate synthase
MFDRLKPLPPRGTWRLDHFSCSTGNAVQPQAHVRLIDPEGQPLDAMGNGQGTIDAICNAIARVTSIPVNVASFEMKSVTHGGDAQAQTTLELKLGRRIYLGRGVSVDILRAVVMACLNAVNEIYWERLRGYIPGAEMDESDDPYLHYSEAGRVIPFSEVS